MLVSCVRAGASSASATSARSFSVSCSGTVALACLVMLAVREYERGRGAFPLEGMLANAIYVATGSSNGCST